MSTTSGQSAAPSFAPNIIEVLNQIQRNMKVSSEGMNLLIKLVENVQSRIIAEAAKRAKSENVDKVGSTHVQAAVMDIFPGQICKHAVSEGTKAVTKHCMHRTEDGQGEDDEDEPADRVLPPFVPDDAPEASNDTPSDKTASDAASSGSASASAQGSTSSSLPASLLSMAIGTTASASSGAVATSRAFKAGLVFPGALVRRNLKEQSGLAASVNGALYLTAVLEYITAELMELSGNAVDPKLRRRITPANVISAVKDDDELLKLFSDVLPTQ